MQQQDYLDAFDYAASIPDVDGDRIAYWGTSFSGGNVIVAAAVDKRMKAAVVQCPFVSGDLAVVAVAPMVPMLLAERAGIKQGLEPSVIPIYADSLEAAKAGSAQTVLSDAEAYKYMEAVSARGPDGGRIR
jgi:dienelactone hydrolase